MKSTILSILLLSTAAITADEITTQQEVSAIQAEQADQISPAELAEAKQLCDEEDLEEDDIFADDGKELPPMEIPKPISPFEAYMREIGVNLLLQYVAMKIWIEHQWHALMKPVS